MTGPANPQTDAHADERAAHLVALAMLPPLGPGTVRRCWGGDPALIWHNVVTGRANRSPELAAILTPRKGPGVVSPEQLAAMARDIDPCVALERHRADGRLVLLRGDPAYPARLDEDPEPPALLFAEGDVEVAEGRTVAIVGTRSSTRPGRDFAARLARDLAALGISVVSGLALGIDGAAHQAAIDAATAGLPGRPIGVIAAGLDIAYPSRHARMHREIARQGLLLSETPLGQRPTSWRFPARNRIIAGLADAVVVVESRSRGGSILTANEAIRRDVPVLAVPGHPTAPAAAGTNDLIYDGAVPLRDLEDVLVAIGLGGATPPGRPVPPGDPSRSWEGPEAAVLAALAPVPASLDEVVASTGLDLGTVSVALSTLEVAGVVVRTGGWFERCGS
jgi:DNA processing protein